MDKKIKIKEVIVVEGRDDTAAILRAVDATTIETHGFGISKRVFSLLDKAYQEKGLIIFTDPDYAGNNIRRRLLKRYPQSKEAFLSQRKATKKDDIGIENASPEAIIEALNKTQYSIEEETLNYDMKDMSYYGLWGDDNSKELREKLGDALGIGYANAKSFAKKLNKYNIQRDILEEKIKEITRR